MAQNEEKQAPRAAPRVIRLGDVTPDFEASTTQGKIKFHEWIGDSWCILFSHPADFTPVCTTDLGMVERLQKEFQKRNCKTIGLSCNSQDDHDKWAKDIIETQGLQDVCPKGKLSYPLIADHSREIAILYGMLDQNLKDAKGLPLTVRSVFVIAPDKIVKLLLTYPASTGRNFNEIIRVLDSLQLTAYHQVATPVNWKDGDDCVILPAVSDDDAKKKFPKGWKALRPYLRMTPQPVKDIKRK
jgi:alkyl hydroperoxide reductase subunit AhpC